jgi:L-lactate dehydrogenase (cytochrome)
MIMSGSSLIRLEDVVQASPATWFQAYLPGDVSEITALIERVARGGFATLVITVDSQVAGNRENNIRAGFSTPLRPTLRLAWDGVTRPRWLFGTFLRTLLQHGMPHFENNFAMRGAPIVSAQVIRDYSDRGNLAWSHFELIRRQWKGRLVIKGLLDVGDARKARDAGADGIIVSNHGGRNFDSSMAPIEALAPIVDAVGSRTTVIVDSGFRRGSDVVKALAIGAKLVMVGRATLWGTTVGGEAGAARAINFYREEISRTLAYLGCRSISDLNRDCLEYVPTPHIPLAM